MHPADDAGYGSAGKERRDVAYRVDHAAVAATQYEQQCRIADNDHGLIVGNLIGLSQGLVQEKAIAHLFEVVLPRHIPGQPYAGSYLPGFFIEQGLSRLRKNTKITVKSNMSPKVDTR